MFAGFIPAVLTRFLSPDQGQSTVEYSAMLTVVVIVIMALGATVKDFKDLIGVIVHILRTGG